MRRGRADEPCGHLPDGTGYYGRLGEIAYDPAEDRVQCHLCGGWFRRVGGSHLIRTHNWSLDAYRLAFRLPRHVATCSIGFSEACRELIAPRIGAGGDFAHNIGRFKRDRAAAREAGRRAVPRRVVAGVRVPFLVRRPELDVEWHEVRNAGLSPEVLGMYSLQLAWWRCSACGHEWQATVKARAHGSGCPRCYRVQNRQRLRQASLRQQRLAAARRPLVTADPSVAAEFHAIRNPDIDVAALGVRSGARVWWCCSRCGHEWQARVVNRTSGRCSGCPACAGKYTPPSRSLARLQPTLFAEWHPTRNGDLDPFGLSPGSGKRVWWRCCTCGNEWAAFIFSRAKDGTGCPACYKTKHRKPPLAARPDLLAEWHPIRNGGLDPGAVRQWSYEHVWWLCPNCGNEWQASPACRLRAPDRGCTRCSGGGSKAGGVS